MQRIFGEELSVNMDVLIGAILADVGKLLEYEKTKKVNHLRAITEILASF